jgi:hypothetical protein
MDSGALEEWVEMKKLNLEINLDYVDGIDRVHLWHFFK